MMFQASFLTFETDIAARAVAGGKVVAAISVAGPESGFVPDERDAIDNAVIEAARLLSRMAGGGTEKPSRPSR